MNRLNRSSQGFYRPLLHSPVIPRITRLICIAFVFGFAGCATPSSSTGIVISGAGAHVALPPGVPHRVAVIPFQGDSEISAQASDQFAGGLPPLGFDVVERQQLLALLNELNFQRTDYVAPETTRRLKEMLGVEGLFLGSITGESSIDWVDSHLNIRLVDLESGRVVWAAEVHDPRSITLSTDTKTSATYTVKNALKILKKDLLKR